MFIWNVLSRVYVSRLSLAPYPHEEWLELGLVQLLKSCVGVALVCCQHRHYVFAAEVALATQLVVLVIKVIKGFKLLKHFGISEKVAFDISAGFASDVKFLP